MRLLVVDDETTILSWIKQILFSNGYKPHTVSTLAEAEKVFAKEQIELVITDIKMPDGSGLDFTRSVKQIRADVGVIVMTAYYSEETALEGIKAGADHYLRKPFGEAQLLEAVKTILNPEFRQAKVGLVNSHPGWHEFGITSSEDSVIKLQLFLNEILKGTLPDDTFQDVSYVISELGRNAIEWGNKYEVEKIAKICVGVCGSSITVKVEDQGEGFDVHQAIELAKNSDIVTIEEERLKNNKRAGGLGLKLMHELADMVVFSEKGNMIAMLFCL